MSLPFSRQPLKTLYLVCAVTSTLVVKVPFWAVKYSIPALRPCAAWSLSKSLIVSLLDAFGTILFEACLFNSARVDASILEKASDQNGFVWVEPAPELVVGEIKEAAETNGIVPVRLGGCWVGKRGPDNVPGQKAEPGEKVVYELHGGGFVMGDASATGYSGYICKELLRTMPQFSRAFLIDYRLSQGPPLTPESAFPAAIVDAVMGYNYLVNTLGFEPSNILVTGESAGGNLATSLVRYLASCTPSLPVPGGALLLSPTADWGDSHMGADSSFTTHRATDAVNAVFEKGYVVRALLGKLPPSDLDTNAWISPASRRLEKTEGLFTGFPPTMIIAGGVEMTLDCMKTLRDRMQADMGKNVTYVEVPNATHVFMQWAWHEPEKSQGYDAAAKWASEVFA